MRRDSTELLKNLLQQRILILDGAMGTMIQRYKLSEADYRGAIALVLGSEGEGLHRLVREKCDFLVRLPMWGKVDSLNVAVAGSIVLYEARRQRGI